MDAGTPDEVARNVELVLRAEAAWNAGDLDALDELFAPDAASHAEVPGLTAGLAGWKVAHVNMMRALPDRNVAVEDVVAEGDLVAVRCRFTGTNHGGLGWAGIPPNSRPVDIPVIGIYRVRDGRIVEHWALNDLMGLLRQVGARREVIGGRVMKGAWPILTQNPAPGT
jgi:predicted ester cyclase